MSVVTLFGGMGTQSLGGEASKPKPMVEMGERRILCHIMTIHSHRRFDHSVTCLGYNLSAALKWATFEALHNRVLCVKGLPKMRAALTSQLCERGVTPAAIRTDVWQ